MNAFIIADKSRLVRTGATVEEYLLFENESEERHEFHNGDVIAMPGDSPIHENIIVELALILRSQLPKPNYMIYSSGLKVSAPSYRRILYPDISVVRGEPQFIKDKSYQLINPTLIIEVLSESTAACDLTSKFEYYRSISSLEEIAYFEREQAAAQLFRKTPYGRWELIEIENGALEFASVQATIRLADAYPQFSDPKKTGVKQL